jgi:hypothetical protein
VINLAAEVFARTVLAFEPYAAEIVYVGGWVHALYLAAGRTAARPVMTDDVDVSVPAVLTSDGRPTLRELACAAGFGPNWLSVVGGVEHLVYEVPHPRAGTRVVDLDLLTESPTPRSEVPIEGQPDLRVQGYPGQRMLQEQSVWTEVGTEIHALLDPSRRIRVPALGAYVVQKGVASTRRAIPAKAVKDLVYIYEIVREPALGPVAVEGIRGLQALYPDECAAWRARMLQVVHDAALRDAVAEQIVVAAGTPGARSIVAARIQAQFERVLDETDSVAG